MRRRSLRSAALGLAVLLITVAGTGVPAGAQGPKATRGGILNSVLTEDPPEAPESVDTVIPELAQRWPWQDNFNTLVSHNALHNHGRMQEVWLDR